jgi:hypothetical protein
MFCGFDELFETMPHLLEVEFVEPQVAVKKKHASLLLPNGARAIYGAGWVAHICKTAPRLVMHREVLGCTTKNNKSCLCLERLFMKILALLCVGWRLCPVTITAG